MFNSQQVSDEIVPSIPFDVGSFFAALESDREHAMAMIASQVPSAGAPSPRAAAFVESGEWDVDASVSIQFLDSQSCVGLVGLNNNRFCGRSGLCSIQAHQVNVMERFSAGWYIPGGSGARSGFYRTPFLPSKQKGGPINSSIAKQLNSSTDPVKLTLGQWKFVFEEWSVAAVESVGSVGTSGVSDLRTPSSAAQTIPPVVTHFFGQGTSAPHGVPVPTGPTPPPPAGSGGLPSVGAVPSAISAPSGVVVSLVALEAQVIALQGELAAMKAHIASVSTLSTAVGGHTAALTMLDSHLQSLNRFAFDDGGDFQMLMETVVGLESKVTVGQGVSAHGASFASPEELRVWMGAHGNSELLGCFHDPISLGCSIGSGNVKHSTALANRKARMDADYATDLVAKVITSFLTTIPPVMYRRAASSEVVDDDHIRLEDKLRNHGEWHNDDGMSGVSQRLLAGSVQAAERIKLYTIRATNDPKAIRLANGLVADSVEFYRGLVQFIDRAYAKLLRADMDANQAWKIVVTYLDQIFSDMSEARSPFQDELGGDDSFAFMLWGIFKCHEVASEYIRVGFDKHPSITSLLVNRMLTMDSANGGRGGGAGMTEKQKKILNKLCDSSTGWVDHQRKLARLTERIDSLE